jgi:hypothetical protein
LVRLREFKSLDGFTAEGAGEKLNCATVKGESASAGPVCQLGGKRIGAITKHPDYLEVALPASLLKSGSGPIEIHWIGGT